MRVFYCAREYACVLLCERVCVCLTVCVREIMRVFNCV